MVIGPIPQFALNDLQIILLLIGIGIFALTPLGDILVIAATHNRCPGNITVAMSQVIFVALARCSVMGQTQIMAKFMAAGFRIVGGVSITQVVEINQCRRITGVIVEDIEYPQVGHTTSAYCWHSSTVCIPVLGKQYSSRGPVERSRLFRGHINVEWRQVFGDTMPDFPDSRPLCGTESGAVAILVIGLGNQRISHIIPCSAGYGMPVKIQVDHVGRTGPAMQQESIFRCYGFGD